MTMSVTSPVTGGAQTGFTSPTYTLTLDTAPDINGRQWAVTALGGTQAGVTSHSVASPFTVTCTRPKVFRALGKPHPVTGLVKDVPMNVYGVLVRKGVTPSSGQPYSICMFRGQFSIPAGADTYDAANVRAAASLFNGAVWQLTAGIGDTAVSGII